MKIDSLLIFIISLFFGSSVSSQVYINEWMASNSSVISDPDFDNTGDWIELYNNNNFPINLSGYFLSDNFNEPTRWTIPDGTIIDTKSHLIFWADGNNVGNHTSFRLTKEAEEIGLYNRNIDVVDQITYKNQKTNVSMGRTEDGSPDFGFFINSTPGTSNLTKPYSGITFYQPTFSQRGGLYTDPISVELEAIDGEIRYTLDGSMPTLDSELYTDPIQIETTTVLRATVFVSDEIPGKPITNTYFFDATLKDRSLPIFSITSDPKYFWDDSIGLYVQDFKPSWEYPINIELFENDGSDRAAFNELAGTRVNGQNSWVLPQKMLGIYFDNDYDKNNLDYRLFLDKDRSRFDNFVLRAGGSDWGRALLRDVLSQGLTEQNMDVENMAFRPSIVYINGQYMGIHNMRSRIDEGYIEENFGLTSSEFDLIENNGKAEEGDNIAFYDLFFLLDEDLSDTDYYNAVTDVLDVRNFTDYFITEIWSSNSSWGHNIQMWKPKAEGSKWRWILQDLDRSFTGVDDDLIQEFTTATSPSGYNWARIPLRSMLNNEGFSQQFAQRFTDHLFTTFHPDRIIPFIDTYANLIDQEMPYHSERWAGTTSSYGNGIPSVSYWESKVLELKDFANGRPSVLHNDLKQRFSLADIVDLTTMNSPKEAGQILINELPIPSSPWQGKYFSSMPFRLEAKPQIGQDFLGWSIARYESIVDTESDWKYLDDGSDQGNAWRSNDFDDASWKEGKAKLGYGENNENTLVSFGEFTDFKHITTYFRKDFTLDDLNSFTGAVSIQLLRDDGAIVYLNGEEIIRSNMPQGDIISTTLASDFVGGNQEDVYLDFTIDQANLIQGKNVIAVEVHQNQSNSSDLGFDLSLKALKISSGTFISQDEVIDVELRSDSIFIANYQTSDICTLPSRISTNTTLDLSCSPYYAISDVYVDSSATLLIEEGVQVFFPENGNLEIYGNILIEGTEESPVLFSAIEDNAPWGGIILKNAARSSTIDFLEVRRASNGNHPIYENAAISAFNSTLEMDHLTVEDVESNPILTYYSDVVLKNSSLHSKVTGDLINVKYGTGKVSNSIFRGNNKIDTDAIDFDGVTNGEIIGNKIFDFLGFNSDGIDIGEEAYNVLIEGNFIDNCSDKAISVGQSSYVIANQNVIVKCNKGIAIKDLSRANINQNTFYSVGVPVSCFEKNIGLGGGYSIVNNSILSNSTTAPIELDDVSDILVTYSLSDTDSLAGDSNYFGNPMFESPSFYDFRLKDGSIASGAGLDDDFNSIDLGVQSNPFVAEPSLMISGIQYFPQTYPDAEFITIYNPKETSVDLEGYMLADAIGFTFPSGAVIEAEETILVANIQSLVSQGIDKKFQWTTGRLSNEGENIQLIAPSGIIIDRVRYDNKAPWPSEAEGLGSFLRLIDPSLDNHFAESWGSNINTTIDEINKISKVFIYPNPTKNIVTIDNNNEIIQEIEIINILGQTVYSSVENTSSVNINIQGLETGTYFIRVNNKMSQNPLIVKR